MQKNTHRNIGFRILATCVAFFLNMVCAALLLFINNKIAPKPAFDKDGVEITYLEPYLFGYLFLVIPFLVPAYILYYLTLLLAGKKFSQGARIALGAASVLLSFFLLRGTTQPDGLYLPSYLMHLACLLLIGTLIPIIDQFVRARMMKNAQA